VDDVGSEFRFHPRFSLFLAPFPHLGTRTWNENDDFINLTFLLLECLAVCQFICLRAAFRHLWPCPDNLYLRHPRGQTRAQRPARHPMIASHLELAS
jgi:hypothetical protein